eukprot:TRINITY_DN37857_c0_g1_i1.p1 TRINITY_DN37857_c0_g1~~TRINITY_DN37857_c0_g1_i1.p1  ORF type:complete len:120 (+),score=0.34 TRINITY_DN37857_c0_g1_i1:553-912(+)
MFDKTKSLFTESSISNQSPFRSAELLGFPVVMPAKEHHHATAHDVKLRALFLHKTGAPSTERRSGSRTLVMMTAGALLASLPVLPVPPNLGGTELAPAGTHCHVIVKSRGAKTPRKKNR